MAGAYRTSDVESRAGESLGLALRVDGDAAWAPLVLAMAEMERNCLACVPQGAWRCFLFRRTTSGLPMEEMLWNLGLRNLIGLFRNLEWVCEMKMEEIRGLNMDLNDGWHFRKFSGIRKLIRKLPHFTT